MHPFIAQRSRSVIFFFFFFLSSNLQSNLELFGRLDEEPQALLHHVGSRGGREGGRCPAMMKSFGPRWRSAWQSLEEQLTGFKSVIYEREGGEKGKHCRAFHPQLCAESTESSLGSEVATGSRPAKANPLSKHTFDQKRAEKAART